LAALHPQLLVSFGVAGAVKNDLHIGDVVSVHSATLLEHGVPGSPPAWRRYQAQPY